MLSGSSIHKINRSKNGSSQQGMRGASVDDIDDFDYAFEDTEDDSADNMRTGRWDDEAYMTQVDMVV